MPMRTAPGEGDVKPFVVVSSPEMHAMAQGVVDSIKRERKISLPHYQVEFERFKNGELLPRIAETVRRQHVFFFQLKGDTQFF